MPLALSLRPLALFALTAVVVGFSKPARSAAPALSPGNTRDRTASVDQSSAARLSVGGWLGALGGGTMDAGVGLRAGFALPSGLSLSVAVELADFPPYGTEGDCYYGYDHFACDHRRITAFAGVGYLLAPQGFSPWIQADAGAAWLRGGSSHVPDETITRFHGTLGAGARYGFDHLGVSLLGTAGVIGDAVVLGVRVGADARF